MLGFTEKAVYCIAQTTLKDKQYPEKCKKRYWHMGKAHKRTVKNYQGFRPVCRIHIHSRPLSVYWIRKYFERIPFHIFCFMPQESNLLSIWLTELPNSQKMTYFEVEDYLHYCRTNYEDFNLTLCRSVLNLNTLLNNITLKSFKTSVSFNI